MTTTLLEPADLTPVQHLHLVPAARRISSPGHDVDDAEPDTRTTLHDLPRWGVTRDAVTDEETAWVDRRLLGRLSERLAFERMVTRLYEGLLYKRMGTRDTVGPTFEQLERVLLEKLENVSVLSRIVAVLGGNPASAGASPDVLGVASSSIARVIADPRTTLTECLDAILFAELIESDTWETVIGWVEAGTHREMVEHMEKAMTQELAHLAKVRGWLFARRQRGLV